MHKNKKKKLATNKKPKLLILIVLSSLAHDIQEITVGEVERINNYISHKYNLIKCLSEIRFMRKHIHTFKEVIKNSSL